MMTEAHASVAVRSALCSQTAIDRRADSHNSVRCAAIVISQYILEFSQYALWGGPYPPYLLSPDRPLIWHCSDSVPAGARAREEPGALRARARPCAGPRRLRHRASPIRSLPFLAVLTIRLTGAADIHAPRDRPRRRLSPRLKPRPIPAIRNVRLIYPLLTRSYRI